MIQYTAQISQFQEGNISSLWYFLHQVPDHRDPRGFCHPLPLVLTIAVLALCCGRRGYKDIASWANDYREDIVREIPFLAGHIPDPSTYCRVFATLDTDAFEAVVASWIAVYAPSIVGDGISMDGKTTAGNTLHTVSAFSHRLGSVLFQAATDTKGKELVVGPVVLSHIPLEERVVTMDALFAQTKLCETIAKRGGGYLITVKDNQETLKRDIQLFFTAPPLGSSITQATTMEKSHGRIETRTLELSADMTDYLLWPGLTHIYRISRTVIAKETMTMETAYGIARLLPGKDTAAHALSYLRGHWRIENRLHWKRDVVFGEDGSTIRKHRAAHVMTILRNIVTTVFHQETTMSFRTTMQGFAARPEELFTMFQLPSCASLYRYDR